MDSCKADKRVLLPALERSARRLPHSGPLEGVGVALPAYSTEGEAAAGEVSQQVPLPPSSPLPRPAHGDVHLGNRHGKLQVETSGVCDDPELGGDFPHTACCQ